MSDQTSHNNEEAVRRLRVEELEVLEVLDELEVTLHLLMWYSSSLLRLQGEKQAICRHKKVIGSSFLSWSNYYYCSRRKEYKLLQDIWLI